ncbi:MAG: hypothetical protein JHD02_08160 [Thermoleophilaceae bacterium]|nr:hypothetical protein [Thermoleophilaceae bacterium]
MKTFLGLVLVGLIVVISVPAAVLASQPDSANVAKKKKTYCQKSASYVKGKLKAKSNGFSVYLEKSGSIILICQDRPKFYGEFSITKGDKLSQLRVTRKKCAILKIQGPTHNPQVYLFDFVNFLNKNGQAAIFTAGVGQPSATLDRIELSSNCVAAFAGRVNGVPQLTVKGTTTFGYTGEIHPSVSPSMTDKELAAVKISGTGASATVTWTEAGVPKSYTYVIPPGF